MGYSTNTNPPKRWFAGRVYMLEAQNCLKRRKGDEPLTINHIIDLIECKINIVRAIRAAVGLEPESDKLKKDQIEDFRTKVSEAGFKKLSVIFFTNFENSVGGSGQYGVPNFSIKNSKTGETASATDSKSELYQKLLKLAYEERRAHIKELSGHIRDLFFDEVYVPGKKHDMFYYHPAESMTQEEFNQYVVRHGFAATEKEAEEKFPDMYDSKDVELQQCFRNDTINDYRISHHAEFWDYNERDSIRHGFSD